LALDLAYNVSSQQNVAIAIGYMLVNEGITPITYGVVEEALLAHVPGLRTQFFRMHVDIDSEHVEQLYDAVGRLDDAELTDLTFGIQLGERGMAVLLDEALGVFEFWALPVAVPVASAS
jgi:hypothetical protein